MNIEASTRKTRGTPINGLKKSQASAIVKIEMVVPTISAKRNAAKETTAERSQPRSGINLSI